MRWLSLLLVAAGLSAGIAHAAPPAAQSDPHDGPTLQSVYLDIYIKMNESAKLEIAGDYRGALAGFEDCYTRLAKIHQSNPNWESALVLTRLKDCQAEITTLEAKLAPPPVHKPAAAATTNSAAAAPESPKARVAELEQAVKASPNDPAALFNLGTAYYQVGETDSAIATLQRGLAVAPGNAYAHNFLGCALLRNGRSSAATKEFQKAIGIDEGYADAHYNLAILYATDDPPAMTLARVQYKRALELGMVPDPHLQKVMRAAAK